MTDKKSPPGAGSFSHPFSTALIVTRLTGAIAKADGWNLDHLVDAPSWLKDMYGRHADAACKEMSAIQQEENNLKPSQH